ncbi:hypothetical protein [Campylobacter helveticus]|uniref:Uncharacterized protein n=1 Tax=Campylobacter helveticus TaxID=28898 RepID=A0AAX2UK39_9BACT|nr:hypothetical protein [Campylobacter helveticus]MCR2039983.1 hypothetical protein [Campylobacter helveticus]MCR2055749.1 hypothetical protein [Campylobacter helveticus]MCR2061166.1 hypothetical protein [Campylobacter helveticus]MCR2064828.1 hypothetical protein [Campylobacter helveticus]TNB54537.1 hypothetical protein FDW47_07460 [Campylobacter helveticus]
MQIDVGQLFNHFQQEKSTKFLCLYTSDLKFDTLHYQYARNYGDDNSNKEVFKIWNDTYAKKLKKSESLNIKSNITELLSTEK